MCWDYEKIVEIFKKPRKILKGLKNFLTNFEEMKSAIKI